MDQDVSEKIMFIGFNQDCGMSIKTNIFSVVHTQLKKVAIWFVLYFYSSECFTCGLEGGYRIYNTEPLKETAREGMQLSDPFNFDIIFNFHFYFNYSLLKDGGGVKHVEMLYRCNYVGIVPGGSSPKYSTKKGKLDSLFEIWFWMDE